ncbi:MAG: dienelactone hydrolase family protein [Alphaproteobacteria bacterium]|nr:dienelactone hydrolase family protein [Alphaproteobacteria bacterium]
MLQYLSHQIGQPRKLVVFLHGYNGSIADHQYAIDWLLKKVDNAVVITPQAPEICDKNPEKFQWFGMIKYDPDRRRSLGETSIADILAIYNAPREIIDDRAAKINQFIDAMQDKFHIDDEQTYLIGFSQGAMLTIYTALTRTHQIGAAFALSGLVAGTELLQHRIQSRPPLYMYHGKNDMKVQYKTLPFSLQWLQEHQIEVTARTYDGLDHRMLEDELTDIATRINAAA